MSALLALRSACLGLPCLNSGACSRPADCPTLCFCRLVVNLHRPYLLPSVYGNNDKSDIYNQFDLDNAFAGENLPMLRTAEDDESMSTLAYDPPIQQLF